MYCLEGSLLWQEILGGHFFVQKNVSVKNSEHFFLKKSCFSPVPKESDRLLNPY